MAYITKLLKKEMIAKDTMAFYWEKPDGFEFIAGQNSDFTLVNQPETDNKGNKRTFSFVNSPYENILGIATRMRDTAYKRSLKNLPIASDVKLDGPYGNFTLHKNHTKPAVFIIGGIGITPVQSIIATATHDKLPHKITLLYSNRTPDDAAFIDDFKEYADKNPNFTFVPVYTKTDGTELGGESGHIDSKMLKKYVPDIAAPIYYLSGSAGMVKAMRQLLIDSGADEDNIRTEEFAGY